MNLGLTVAQVAGGVLAGSLALIADAVHNLSDAVSLGIALFARRIGRRPADAAMTFGYRRAEVIAALINLTTLILLGFYLIVEAVARLIEPEPVQGWIVVGVATVALAVDLVTAALTWRMSKTSLNIRAAFLHNLADALGSVAVIVTGALVLLFGWDLADPIATLLIAFYVLWHGAADIGQAIRILMGGAPAGVETDRVAATMAAVAGVVDVHHLHVWAMDEHRASVEAHVVIRAEDAPRLESVKAAVKRALADGFAIHHTTIEIELDAGAGHCAEPALIAQGCGAAAPQS